MGRLYRSGGRAKVGRLRVSGVRSDIGVKLTDEYFQPFRPVMEKTHMPLHPAFGPVAALIAGILILIMPRLLNYIVAIYLIIIGILGLLNRSM